MHVGATLSKVMDKLFETGPLLLAESCAALAFTWHVTAPCPLGVTGRVYVVPLPLNVPLVPFVTVIPEAVRPVTDSENVSVKLIGLVSVGLEGPVTVQVGATLSKVMDKLFETVLLLLAESCAALAFTWHVTAP